MVRIGRVCELAEDFLIFVFRFHQKQDVWGVTQTNIPQTSNCRGASDPLTVPTTNSKGRVEGPDRKSAPFLLLVGIILIGGFLCVVASLLGFPLRVSSLTEPVSTTSFLLGELYTLASLCFLRLTPWRGLLATRFLVCRFFLVALELVSFSLFVVLPVPAGS